MTTTSNNNNGTPSVDYRFLDSVLDAYCGAVSVFAQNWADCDELDELDLDVVNLAVNATANLSFAGLMKLVEVAALSAFGAKGEVEQMGGFMSFLMTKVQEAMQAKDAEDGEEVEEVEVPVTKDGEAVSLLEKCLQLDA